MIFFNPPDYEGTGFLALQYALDMAIIQHFNASANLNNFDFFMKKMPYPPYTKDNLTTILQMYLPFFIILGFILSSLQTTKAIVYEKENKLKVTIHRHYECLLNIKRVKMKK